MNDLVNDLLNMGHLVEVMLYSLVSNAASVFIVGIYLSFYYVIFLTAYRYKEVDGKLIAFKKYKWVVSFALKVVAMAVFILFLFIYFSSQI